ncbi:hypothetical protein [Methylomicrobium lacus]|uniref:hypothetical protein n=1 Tax=Methylomicrobium lacus TaxID=136992 RepID=UPI0035A92BCA
MTKSAERSIHSLAQQSYIIELFVEKEKINMTIKNIMPFVILALVMSVGEAAFAETEHEIYTTPYNGTISGTVISSEINAVNPEDGANGILGNFAVASRKFGHVTAQAFVEDIPVSTPTGNCKEGTDAEFTLGTVRSIHRFPNGDLLYLNALTRSACLDFETLTVHTDEEGEFTGGTGRFAKATGTWRITGAANLWVIDPSVQFFGPFSGELSGTIITPTPILKGK